MSTLIELATIPVPRSTGPDSGERDRLIGRAKAPSWLRLAWMTVEGTVAVTAALIAGSVAQTLLCADMAAGVLAGLVANAALG